MTKNTKWTKEKMIEGVLEVVKNTNLTRMPTSSEVSSYYGDYKLSSAISRSRLWKPLADELNLEIKDSETAFGKQFEAQAMEYIIGLGYDVEKMPQNFPYDLLVENTIKIDVKVSKMYRGTNGDFYTFNLERPYPTCDIMVLYLVNAALQANMILVIPTKFISKNTQISVGIQRSKYHRYDGRWDYIERFLSFQEGLA